MQWNLVLRFYLLWSKSGFHLRLEALHHHLLYKFKQFCPSAANWAALGICYNTGQDCTAGSRVYVQDSIYDKFLDILVGKVKEQVIGDAFDEKSGGGPVVCQSSLSIVPYLYLIADGSPYLGFESPV